MIKIIYHANCSDGFCAAYLFWLEFGNDAEYIPMHYGVKLDLEKFNKNDDVFILDFSFRQPVIWDLAENVNKIVILDHHKTAQQDLDHDHWPPHVTVIFNMDKSGAQLAWEYYHGYAEPPDYVKYIEDRDLWRFLLPFSREVSAYVQCLPFDFVLFDKFVSNWDIDLIIAAGQAILMKINSQVESAVKNAVLRELIVPGIGTFIIPVVNTTVNFSEVAGELAKEHDFGVAWFYRGKDKKYQYSLRSKEGFDVSAVAKAFGGGGHAQAAGFESDTFLLG